MRMAKGQEETPSEGKNIKNRAAYGIRDSVMLFFAKDHDARSNPIRYVQNDWVAQR